MSDALDTGQAIAALGSQEAFQQLIDPYRREILVHCYRILGSLEDAEDALQETLLRAWRRLDSFTGRGPLRAWLYKIATHTALDATEGRKARTLPQALAHASDPRDQFSAPESEVLWVGPCPDAILFASDNSPEFISTNTPEAIFELHESVSLAFLTALQLLPGRQRAVLILRDVLGWQAGEVAELLDMSTAAVNSALQRARATLTKHAHTFASNPDHAAEDSQTAELLAQYVAAWEDADIQRLVSLLRDDAVYTMPPLPQWFQGRASVELFLAAQVFSGAGNGQFRLRRVQANGCPAFAAYARDAGGTYRPSALQVLSVVNGRIAAVQSFLTFDGRLFSQFGLPQSD